MDKIHLTILFLGIFVHFLHVNAQAVNESATIDENESPENIRHSWKLKILNGVTSQDQDYAYHVSVMQVVDDVPVLLCGGAIIGSRYVLTAAHCVVDRTNDQLVVRSGSPLGPPFNHLHKDSQAFRRVFKVMIPRQYSKVPCRKHQHDIAVLQLQQCFDLTDVRRYKKAILPSCDSDFEGLTATLTGYGADYGKEKVQQPIGIENFYLEFPTKLRAMPVKVISNEFCQDQVDVIVTEGNMCAMANDKDMQSCFQDDGGPLVINGVVVGILHRSKCEDSKVPEIFTKVSNYLHFINNILKHRNSADILTYFTPKV